MTLNPLPFAGKRFGRLVAMGMCKKIGRKELFWACKCDCGNTHIVVVAQLKKGKTLSCGCLRKIAHSASHLRHGEIVNHCPSMEYRTYINAKERCENRNSPAYKYYGGRGIEFRFASFEEFLACLGRKPSVKLSVDRIDVNGHYEIGNVRWADRITQANNRRNSIRARNP